jgi:uncharacterized protein
MKPLFLGNAQRRLYGVYHSAARSSRHAVLLCYPGMQEYNSAHWAFRRLAATLARDGHHVMRFDYYGTGDSAGGTEDGNPTLWLEDVRQAAEELKDQSGARSLSVIGLRLGATLATLASAGGLQASRLLLWEPVISGRAYVKELETLDERRNLMLLHANRTRGRRDELLGHAFPPALRSAIEALDLADGVVPKAEKVLIFTDQPRPEHDAFKLSLERAGIAADLKVNADSATDGRQEVRERTLIPSAVLSDMAQELRGLLAA